MLASLVAEAWSVSFTALNILSGFKKCGIFPINPSEISDGQIGPSKAVCCHARADTNAVENKTTLLTIKHICCLLMLKGIKYKIYRVRRYCGQELTKNLFVTHSIGRASPAFSPL